MLTAAKKLLLDLEQRLSKLLKKTGVHNPYSVKVLEGNCGFEI